MKHILVSIKPEYVCKILNKEKLLEIRKSIPKCVLNGEECIVEIYCTKSKNIGCVVNPPKSFIYKTTNLNCCHIFGNGYFGNGKVVAKFTLKTFEILKSVRYRENGAHYQYNEVNDDILQKSCLTQEQILDYTNGKDLYAWHIEDLYIYDKPKELSDFKKENKCHYASYEQGCCFENCTFFDLKDCDGKCSKITIAPQSWCYIEGEDDESICD